MTTIPQATAAREFAQRWQGKGYEKGESQIFWTTLLAEVFGVGHVDEWLQFEQQVRLDHTSFIDAYIPRTHTMIEQKSIEKNLGAPIRQSDGSMLNPFQQAKRYAAELPYSQRPRWIVTCNFREFWVYDMEQPNGEPQKILLQNLEKEYYRLQFLVDEGNEYLKREMEVSVKAGELVGMIYDKLLEQYTLGTRPSPSAGSSEGLLSLTSADDVKHGSASLLSQANILRSLNILCVRLVFCLYAEDAGLFHSKTAFHDYLANYKASQLRSALIRLFEILDTPLTDRDPYLDEDLAAFPYVNGGLFDRHTGEDRQAYRAPIIPQFTEELKLLLLEKASADFDWSEISPTIFGAVFESTLNPETRRSGGMHYTSIENIHKVIDPLFMNDLWAEFEGIVARDSHPSQKTVKDGNCMRKGVKDGSPSLLTALQKQALLAFQDKLASLTFLDPACGSGNFLTETYLSLRRLENEVIQAMYGGANILTFDTLIKVSISQFHGIEINDFACTVAKTALWIAENQMMQQTSAIAGKPMDFLPLKTNANIHEGNALRMDWNEVFSISSPAGGGQVGASYIIGNPPFVGYSLQSKEQKEDILNIYKDEKGRPYKTAGKIDYVAGWYWKAAELMLSCRAIARYGSTRDIRAALVSTNSITQGEQVAAIWQPLFDRFGIQIDFAWRTFRWDSEADIKAHVHCVIIGFSINTVYRDNIGIAKGCNIVTKDSLVVKDSYPSHPTQIGEARKCNTTEGEGKDSHTTNPFFTKNTIIDSYKSRLLPHWQQSGKYVFVTCHLGDSLPQNLLTQIKEERELWIKNHIEPLTDADKAEYHRLFSQKIEDYLDAGYGDCYFKDDYCANIVKDTLEFYDSKKYHIIAYVIMPNHIHLLLQLTDIEHYPISDIMHGIKSYTTKKVNEYLGTTGSIWHDEYYDRLIRNEKHYTNTINYILKNANTAHTKYIFVRDSVVVKDSYPSQRACEGKNSLTTTKRIFLSDNQTLIATNINPYLMDAPVIWITARQKPLCQVPEMLNGGKPVEGGFLILTEEERNELLAKEPQAAPLLRPYMMGKDFIERKPRYCLWLVGANPTLLRQCHEVMRRVQAVKEYRLGSPKEATRKAAETPTLFAEVRECPSDYIALPKVSSENRRYIPMEYLSKDIIAGDKLFMIPDASLYMFGVLTSNVHMAWMRAVCGRLKSDYSYSNTIVYNNFPWPFSSEGLPSLTQTDDVKHGSASLLNPTLTVKDGGKPNPSLFRITATAQAILDARTKYPDCSLADLYDETTMPPELRKAHQDNDRAVMAAYGFSPKMTESECVAELFRMYREMMKE